jgi:hypothetical protein
MTSKRPGGLGSHSTLARCRGDVGGTKSVLPNQINVRIDYFDPARRRLWLRLVSR